MDWLTRRFQRVVGLGFARVCLHLVEEGLRTQCVLLKVRSIKVRSVVRSLVFSIMGSKWLFELCRVRVICLGASWDCFGLRFDVLRPSFMITSNLENLPELRSYLDHSS